MERTFINEGKSGRIYTVPGYPDLVEKVSRSRIRSYSIKTQKRIHRLCEVTITTAEPPFHILHIPAIADLDSPFYRMERVDTSCPLDSEALTMEPILVAELVRAWKLFWEAGVVAWDFELYLQSDGTVFLLDFDSFGIRYDGDLPPSSLFENSCFPPHFREMLK